MAKGPSGEELKNIKNSLRELEQLYAKLGGTNPFQGMSNKNIASSVDEVTKLKNTLEDAREAVSDMDGEAGDLFKSWKAITDEVKGYRGTINDSKSSVSKVNDLSQKLKDHHSKINVLSSKDLSNVKSKLEQSKSTLKINQTSLQSTIDELTTKSETTDLSATELSQLKQSEQIQKNISGGLETNSGLVDTLIKKAGDEADKRKEIEKSLGVTGGILKGMSKIPLIKDIVDTEKILKAANDEIELSGSGVKGLGAGFKEMGSQIKGGLTNPANLALGAITEMVTALVNGDKATGELAKGMNMTYGEALNTRRELGNMAAMSGDAALNTKNLQETYMAVGQSLGTNAKLNEKDLTTMTKLVSQAGFQHSELMEIEKLSLANNKTLEDNTSEILGGAKAYASRKGIVVNEKDVLREVNKMSASLKLSLGGSASAMAEAVVKTKEFGLNLEQASKISSSLLNFESSIENELSAELLLGKDLNFERARGLALNNDIAGAAEEIAKQVGTSADFANMNAIQQEAIAKAAGMERNELAQSLIDKEALTKIGFKDAEAAKAKYETLRKTMTAEEAAKALGDEALANQYEQQTVQDRFAQATEKLKDIFVSIAEPILAILSPLMDIVSTVLPAINFLLSPLIEGFSLIGSLVSGFINGLKEGNPIIVAITAALVAMKAQAIMTAIFGIFESFAKIPYGIGIPLAITAVAGMVSLATSSSKKGNDIMSPGGPGGGYGSRTLLGPEGAIQLNNKDTVIAGTNLFGGSSKGDDVISDPKGDDVMSVPKGDNILPSPKENNTTSTPKGAISVSNKTTPKKEIQQNPNAKMEMKMDDMIKAINTYNLMSTLKVQ